MTRIRWRGGAARLLSIGCLLGGVSVAAAGQEGLVTSLQLTVGRSYPITTATPLTHVSVANPEVADLVVISEREMVINAKAPGETDALVWQSNGSRQHYRVLVRSSAERKQIIVGIKFAEVRRDALREIGVSGLYRDAHTRAGTGIFRNDAALPNGSTGGVSLPPQGQFLSVLTDFSTDRLLAFLDLQEQKGRSRTLAEPTVMAGNREPATFLAGGELPIPVTQGGGAGDLGVRVTIQYKEFGVRLKFLGEIIGDSLVKLTVSPEVSSLDFGNAITLSGFRIPAFRTRRVETTVDVRPNESLIISGLFDDEREHVRTGIPGLMNIPILGQLFSSTRWQQNESELLVVVTPVVVDPLRPRPEDLLPIVPDTTLPAREAIKKRLPPPPPARQPPR
ncbi:MAG: pilus assembly protein N-terminal domain-containing protein [Gemmatimonadota bacterium]|nr:pilus assembly protein N-terminal domain-containing protein [Gemmatimonadota bacterium]